MADFVPTAVTPATQAIRLATTVTGGVSLAVWMGGVAREINLLSQASAWRSLGAMPSGGALTPESRTVLNLYRELIDLLDVTVDTDVLSGTSAGGINAALLGYARANSCDLGNLRDLWLDLGALLDLLRDPRDVDLPSLMYGDERMFAELVSGIPNLAGAGLPDAGNALPRTTVLITTTLLDGETSRFTDSYGTTIQDVDHRGLFTFTEDQLHQMRSAGQPEPLALAARSSASFPGAFEPGFVPFHAGTAHTKSMPARPDMSPYTAITRSHWVADGGLLDNQPLDVLLQRVFARRSSREVRRVLLFVVPSAGPSPSILPPTPGDDPAKPYGLLDSLRKDLDAMTSQSVASSLRAIHDHADASSARGDMRLQLADLGTRLGTGRLLTEQLLADYRSSAADILARTVVAEVMRQLGTWPAATAADPQPAATIPLTWQAELTVGGDCEQHCRDAVRDALTRPPAPSGSAGSPRPDALPPDPSTETAAPAAPPPPVDPPPLPGAIPTEAAELVGFGAAAFDDAHAAAIAAVRIAFRLAVTAADRTALAALTAAIHAAPGDRRFVDVAGFIREQLAQTVSIRSLSLPEACAQLAVSYRESTTVPAQAWLDLGGALVNPQSTAVLRRLASSAPVDPDAPPLAARSRAAQRHIAARQLQTCLDYVRPDEGEPLPVALRLFDLAAAQRAMLPADASVDQPVEFIQLSSDTRTLLDPDRQTAQSKLTGEQLHHFGAFYKRSWRANDWMWGRLDAAGWLVHILLDPRRLQTITAQAVTAVPAPASPDLAARQPGAAWLINRLIAMGVPELGDAASLDLSGTERRLRSDPWPATGSTDDAKSPPAKLTKRALWAELTFLDDDTAPMPTSLPLTSLWVAQVWQQVIAGEELPVVADAVYDSRDGQPPDSQPNRIPTATANWAATLRRIAPADLPNQIAAQLAACPVPQETFTSDTGSPLMVRTAAKAAATAAAALGSVSQLPSAVRPALTSLRTLTLAGYRVTNAVRGAARVMILAGIVALALGIALAIQQSLLFGMSGLALAAVGAYLIVFGAWQTSRLALIAVIAVTLTGGTASLAVPVVRRGLFGTGTGTDYGVVGRNIDQLIRWLATTWWHPLIILAVLLLLPTAVGLALNAFRQRAPGHAPAPVRHL